MRTGTRGNWHVRSAMWQSGAKPARRVEVFHLIESGVKLVRSQPGDRFWYALKVRTRSEPVALIALRVRGYDPFCPMYKEKRRYCDRMKVIEVPVFPGYVFCRLDTQKKAPVLSSPAVEYIVSFGGSPAIVPDEEIEAVGRVVAEGAKPGPYPTVGQRVRVAWGPLVGVEGVLARAGDARHLLVSVHLLKSSVRIEIPEYQVRAV
jgi:transcription antitermination factor NusG